MARPNNNQDVNLTAVQQLGLKLGWGAITILTATAAPLNASEQIAKQRAEPSPLCPVWPEPQRLNTGSRGDTLIIGQQIDQPYRVIIPSRDTATLSNLKTCVPDAFMSQMRMGDYIQVGSFTSRSEAEDTHQVLQEEGYRSRVIYQPSRLVP